MVTTSLKDIGYVRKRYNVQWYKLLMIAKLQQQKEHNTFYKVLQQLTFHCKIFAPVRVFRIRTNQELYDTFNYMDSAEYRITMSTLVESISSFISNWRRNSRHQKMFVSYSLLTWFSVVLDRMMANFDQRMWTSFDYISLGVIKKNKQIPLKKKQKKSPETLGKKKCDTIFL